MDNAPKQEENLTAINIAPCGLVCSQCDAYRATQENNKEKLERVAADWNKAFCCCDITAEGIVCDGCLNTTGRNTYFCTSLCTIRRCAIEKKVYVCSKCSEYPCQKLNEFLEKGAPDGKAEKMKNLLKAIVDVEQSMHKILS